MKKLIVTIALALALAPAAYAQTAPDVGKPSQPTGEPPPPPAPTPVDAPAATGAGAPAAAAQGAIPPLPIGNKKCGPKDDASLPQWIRDLDEACWDTGGNFWFPPAAAKAAKSDFMFYAILALSAFFFFGILICVVYFTIRYRHRKGNEKPLPSSSHNDVLEITWTIIPTIICVFLFVGGWNDYIEMSTRPAEPIQIKVTAKKWNWDFEYPNGLHLPNLVVPADRPVELQMTSVDVLHSFWVPAFRTKQDVVPRRYTYAYVDATRPGVYRLYCTEYCGRDHSQMKVKAIVLDYNLWLRYLDETNAVFNQKTGPELGRHVYETKGCQGCHSVDGSRIVGPSWKGSWGQPIPLEGGGEVPMNAEYVHTAINEPAKQVHAGYPNSMPSYAGQLSEAEINGVAAYIESLK